MNFEAMATDIDDSAVNCLIAQENTSTVMKGVLWQQPNYGKFHQRIFTRWKKRFFVLTTDYLVCFKRSTAKVGRSKMGEFLYKTSLSDIQKIEWLKPNKSDKGAIVLLINGQFNLFLWSKKNLDEWMYVIQEAVQRNKICRQRNSMQHETKSAKSTVCNSNNHINHQIIQDLYENTTASVMEQQLVSNNVKKDYVKKLNDLSRINEENIKESQSDFDGDKTDPQATANHSNNDDDQSSPKKSNNLRSQEQRRIIDKESKKEKTEKSTVKSLSSQSSCERRISEIELKADSKDNLETKADQRSGRRAINDGEELNNADGSGKDQQLEERTTINDLFRSNKSNDSSRDHTNASRERKSSNESQPSELTNSSNGSCNPKSPKTSNSRTSPMKSDKIFSKANACGLQKYDEQTSQPYSDQSSLTNTDIDKENDGLKKKSNRSLVEPLEEIIQDKNGIDLVESRRKLSNPNNEERIGKSKNVQRKESLTSESDVASCNSNNQPIDTHDKSIISDIEDKLLDNSLSKSHANGNEEQVSNSNLANDKTAILSEKLARRPVPASLIRRDDSWQSLVSLTRVGKVKPYPIMVQQRSLYAQHIMPESASNDRLHNSRQHMINIESTVTPSRAAPSLMRQHWIQANSMQNSTNNYQSSNQFGAPNVPSQRTPGSKSFDTHVSNSPLIQHPMSKPNITSYQHKLLQLQLLHNSNNVDYIRHYGTRPANDYQIYGPESVTTNHYGYSSMRSNLKSAASEFSFIRPSSSGHSQSTLPHPPYQQQNHSINQFVIKNRDSQAQLLNNCSQTSNRGSLILNNNNLSSPFNNKRLTRDINNNDVSLAHNLCSPSNKQHCFINPVTGERISSVNHHHHTTVVNPVFASYKQAQDEPANVGALLDNKMMAPLRDLPSKPNKKRAQTGTAGPHTQLVCSASSGGESGQNLRKSSSLTLSIACFFRRAFSRRSKKSASKKVRSSATKLAESCNSSMGNFEDGNCVVPLVPSAFSTGSKSIDGGRKNQSQHVVQSHRMIDMIEAFTNKTLAAAAEETRNESSEGIEFTASNQQIAPRPNQYKQSSQFVGSSRLSAGVSGTAADGSLVNANGVYNAHDIMTPTQVRARLAHAQLNQFGSPLHKSNSISATMGLSLAETSNLGRRALLYDNELLVAANNNNNNSTTVAGGSPMMMRMNNVMNTNLTPLMSRANDSNQQHRASFESSQQQYFMSPRTSMKVDQLPRPSSIYGQPSMISSPIMMRDEVGTGRINFGNHRNSLHNQHFRDLQAAKEGLSNLGHSVGNSSRRQQMVKLPFMLDTTREVAEELASPTETSDLNSGNHLTGISRNGLIESPLSQRLNGRKQTANRDIISSSPSSGRLLNHYHQQQAIVNPILQSPTMDAIYDNHPILSERIDFGSNSHHENHANPQTEQYHYQRHSHRSPSIKTTNSTNNFQLHQSPSFVLRQEDLYSSRNPRHSQGDTPKRSSSGRHHQDRGAFTVVDMLSGNNRKPSAIVVPSTASNSFCEGSSSPNHHYTHRNQDNASPSSASMILAQPNCGGKSPLMGRRSFNNTSHYQQSPLVSQQTRILTKGIGVQATIIGDRPVDANKSRISDSFESSGAGETKDGRIRDSEPSLIQRTNTGDPYECSISDRFDSESNHSSSKSNSKTFLVSTRLSNATAHEQGSSSTVGDSFGSSCSSSAFAGASFEKAPVANQRKSLKESAPKQSIHTSQKNISKTKSSESKQRNSVIQEDRLEGASFSSDTTTTNGSNKHNLSSNDSSSSSSGVGQNRYREKNSSRLAKRSKGRESSTEQSESDTNNRSQTDSLEKFERDRNWINSKLIE